MAHSRDPDDYRDVLEWFRLAQLNKPDGLFIDFPTGASAYYHKSRANFFRQHLARMHTALDSHGRTIHSGPKQFPDITIRHHGAPEPGERYSRTLQIVDDVGQSSSDAVLRPSQGIWPDAEDMSDEAVWRRYNERRRHQAMIEGRPEPEPTPFAKWQADHRELNRLAAHGEPPLAADESLI